jgi:transposase
VHSDEFKADAVAACQHPGVSIASVAMAHKVNANLLRRWVKAAESGTPQCVTPARAGAPPTASFVPLQLPPPPAVPAPEIRIELRRGATAISVTWPSDAAAECAAWMRELLR